ncbi:hypothetical protein QLX08_009688 [Tetragonisca angustula]|uniref:Uncharacterized protein n=1 Tax=Tetragonisca angustula TaxID=166442 RepID=A0AAW0ZFQ3_9HYME
MMERPDTETETEECYPVQKYHDVRRKQTESYHDLKHKCCLKCNQPWELPPTEFGRRRARRTKDHVQHCPSCHCPPEAVKYSIGRTNCSKNMDAVLNEYEHLLTHPANQMFKRSQSSPLSPRLYGVQPCNNAVYAHYHPRKRQTSRHRRQCRNEQEQILSITKNSLHGNDNGNFYCEYPRSVKNNCKKEDCYMRGDDQAMAGIMKAIDVDNETVEKCTQHKKERTLKPEPRTTRHHVDKVNKINVDERYDFGDHKNDGWLYTRGRLRFNLSKHEGANKMEEEGFENDRNAQGKSKPNVQSNKVSILKGCGSQITSKNRNLEDLSKHKVLPIDANDYTKEGNLPKKVENRLICKPLQRSPIRQNSPRSPGKESTSNSEETRDESSCCELAVKDEDHESPNRKNIYAGGDLDLDLDIRATKTYIVDLIDRVLSKKFAMSPGQPKNEESNRELTEEGFSIEIIRALRGDCCEDLSAHHETPAECIKHLKNLRWKHMQHIQDEFKKLCDLQKFLDEYSPRQSLPPFQSGAVEQRVEERQQQQQQQQHEEKQNLGTIS